MCGACGRGVASPTTAFLNEHGLTRRALARLRGELAPGCRLTLEGDAWTLIRRSGRGEHHADVEGLIASLEGGAAGDWAGAEPPREVVAAVTAGVVAGARGRPT